MTDLQQRITEIAEALYQYGRSMERRGLTTAPWDEPVTVASSIQAIHTLIEEELEKESRRLFENHKRLKSEAVTEAFKSGYTRGAYDERLSRLTNQGDNT